MNQENALPRRKAMLYYPSQPKPRPVRLREKDRDPYDGLRPWSAITHGIGAALALLVLDGSRPLTAEDEDAIATAAAVPRQLVILNKTDLPAGVEPAALSQRFGQLYPLSAATGEGVDALCRAVEALYPAGRQAQGELLTNARQADAVARSLEAVRSARRALENGMTPDAVLTDAEAALEALGELNGKRIREDLVQTIFSRFCVGK